MRNLHTSIVVVVLVSLLVLLVSSSFVAAEEAPEVEWSRIFGGTQVDYGHAVEQTSDGGYVFVGETMSQGSGRTDVWLVKTDAAGNQVWERTFGTTYLQWGEEIPAYDYGSSVQQTNDGGYIIVGACKSKGYGYRSDKLWLIKTDADGDSEWDRVFNTIQVAGPPVPVTWSSGSSVRQTTDGGYIIAGACQSSSTNQVYLWLIKTNASGESVWEQIFADPSLTGYELVRQTSEGGYVVVGCKAAILTDIWMIKTNSNGVLQWETTFGREYEHYSTGEIVPGTELPTSIRQTSDGGYIIAATSQSGWDQRGWVIKTNAVGEMMWEIVSDPWTFTCAAQQTTDGGYIIFGTSEDCIRMAKTDSEGNQLWEKLADCWYVCGTEDGLQCNDGGYVAIATIKLGSSWSDVALVKVGLKALACVATSTDTGTACLATSNGTIEELESVPAPSSLPHGVRLPHGMFTFKITGLTPRQSVTMTAQFPDPIPTHWVWWKYHDGVWSHIPIGRTADPRIITVTLVDDGTGDFDDILGQITDPGGPGNPGSVGWETYPINKARVLLPWVASLLAGIGGAGLLVLRRRRTRS